jgi:hypothetical protein
LTENKGHPSWSRNPASARYAALHGIKSIRRDRPVRSPEHHRSHRACARLLVLESSIKDNMASTWNSDPCSCWWSNWSCGLTRWAKGVVFQPKIDYDSCNLLAVRCTYSFCLAQRRRYLDCSVISQRYIAFSSLKVGAHSVPEES